MKFSVLLPTRNRLDLLISAIETVRRQEYDDWEIVVSDNASEEDIAGYVRSISDPRIKYVRTPAFVPVTENWNNALDHSSGDYIVMLGDDDCLLKGFFSTMHALIEEFHHPESIYTNALVYAYPGVMKDTPEGFLKPYGYAPFFEGATKPFLLDRASADRLVRDAMHFRMSYTFNMQHSVFSRDLVNRLSPHGPFFQSPYPDFYATNVILLKAETLIVHPEPVVVIGISPKSFGYYYFNDQEKRGVDFLKNVPDADTARRMEHVILPGPHDRTSWLLAMELIKVNYGSESGLDVDYKRYRFLQIMSVYSRYAGAAEHNTPDFPRYQSEFDELVSKLTGWERVRYLPLLRMAALVSRGIPRQLRSRMISMLFTMIGKTPQLDAMKERQSYATILEVFEKVDPQHQSLGIYR